jgi:hypothetical protein
MRKMAALIAAAAALGLAPRHASAQTLVTCESVNGNRQVCGANTAGGVSLRQQLSGMACVQGQNWGYTRNAIWVSNGCRAQFVVNGGRQYNDGRKYDDGRDGNVYNNGRVNDNGNVNNAEALCRRAVRSQLGRRVEVSTWMANNSRNNARVGWRLANGRSGQCRFDRAGNVSVLVNRGR